MKLSKFNNYYNPYGKEANVDLKPIKDEIAGVKNDVVANTNQITDHTNQLNNHSNLINENSTNIGNNAANIAANIINIKRNEAQITEHTNQLNEHLIKITENTEKITANKKSIQANTTGLAATQTELQEVKNTIQTIKPLKTSKTESGNYIYPKNYTTLSVQLPYTGQQVVGNPVLTLVFNIAGVSYLINRTFTLPSSIPYNEYVCDTFNVLKTSGSLVGTINILMEILPNGIIWIYFNFSSTLPINIQKQRLEYIVKENN